MIHFVVNLHNQLPHLGNATPYLYPKLASDELQILWPKGSKANRIQKASSEIFATLDTTYHQDYALIFLLSLPPTGEDPFSAAVCGTMEMIRKHFFNATFRTRPPQNCFLLILDEIHNDFNQSQNEVPKFYEHCLKVDLGQLGGDHFDFSLLKTPLQKMDKVWSKASNAPEGEILNRDFHNLSKAFQDSVNEGIQELSKILNEIFGHEWIKSFANRFLDGVEDDNGEKELEAIKSEWEKQILGLKSHPEKLKNFIPSKCFKGLISSRFSIFSSANTEQFTTLRLPFKHRNPAELQIRNLQLAALIGLIIDENKLQAPLQKGNHWVKIQLRRERLVDMNHAYHEALMNAKNVMVRKAADLNKGDIQLVENQNKQCTESITDFKLNGLHLGFLYNSNSLKTWEDWMDTNKKRIRDFQDEAGMKLQRCSEEDSNQAASLTTETIEQLDAKLLELNRQKEDLQDNLQERFAELGQLNNSVKEKFESKHQLKSKLEERPSGPIISSTLLIMILCLATPLIFYQKGMLYLLVMIVCGSTAALLSFFVTRSTILKSIRQMLSNNLETARTRKNNVLRSFEKQKKYLADLKTLSVLRQNVHRLTQFQKERNDNKLIHEYHSRKLNEHAVQAKSTLKILQAGDPNDSFEVSSNPDLDAKRRVVENEVYCPLSTVKKSDNLSINIQQKHIEYSGIFSHMVEICNIEPDMVYKKVNQ